jgi:hypothetical protein
MRREEEVVMARFEKSRLETETRKINDAPASQPEVKRSGEREDEVEDIVLQENKNPDDFE